jgi:hypothetical protein
MYIDAQRLLSRCCNALVPSVAGSECLLLTLPHRGEQNYQKSVRGQATKPTPNVRVALCA